MLTSREIRRQFVDFFVQRHGHTFVPSSPVVPHGDPTLLFANAGMNQFKDVFLGTGHRPYTRAVDTQKCIRAGGKHNDLEDVGKDTYHHTFFEMLGNWSFGDYFKKEAVAWAWDLLVTQWGLDPTRLHATYFQGDPAEHLDPDFEARDLWLQHLPAERVHPGNKKDNFWEMGETGPCGPCSEIHIDRTPDKTGGKLVNAGDARVMEIWNLVFIQYNRDSAGKLTPLPAKHVDTGMGFERITAVIQKKDSNYETDVFAPIFVAIQEVTKARPYGGKLDDAVDIAYRIIADHIRTLTFAVTDGAVISNEGRGYVLRRILRRAVRHGRQTLGVHEPFFYRLVPAVVSAMGDAFPELAKSPQHVQAQLKEEEESFGRTLDRGIELFEQAAGKGGKQISAEDAFKLYDTYGFPLDLTQVMADERGLTVDVAGFEKLMEAQRQRSRLGGEEGGDLAAARESLVTIVQQEKLSATEFHGYAHVEMDATAALRLYALRGGQYVAAPSANAGEKVAVVLDRTSFYGESGGQVGDQGTIACGPSALVAVDDTLRVGDVFFHLGTVQRGPFAASPTAAKTFHLSVDAARRARIAANHTTTHLLNHKLRAILGDHVQQKGSLVDDQKLRFDFTNPAALTDQQLGEVEDLVNADIVRDLPVDAQVVPQQQALKIHGLRAVFGEKYPPNVRVLSVGVPVKDLLAAPDKPDWYQHPVEFCGGTHLTHTAAAGGFTILAEEAIGKGLRRITAQTGDLAKQTAIRARELLQKIEQLAPQVATPEKLVEPLAELSAAVSSAVLPASARAKLRAGLSPLQSAVKEYEKARSRQAATGVVDQARQIAESASDGVIVAAIPGADADSLRIAMDVIRKRRPEAALLLAAASADKIAFVAAVPPALIQKGLKAGDWVREVAKVAGGGGGGRPDMAQAGGKDPAKLDAALQKGREFAAAKV